MANENLNLPVLDYAGNKVGEVVLPEDIFGVEVNEFAVQRAIRVDLSNRRTDTAHTLDRSVVHGSNRKPYGQKHTGRARAGTTNSPIWRHGGVVHGPDGNQNHTLKMNKKEHNLALCSALSDKAANGNITVLTDVPFATAKTKDFAAALKALNAADCKTLIVLNGYDENLVLAARNIPSIVIADMFNLSVYDIVNAKKLVLVKGYLTDTTTQEEAE